jgi:hypothetical protein
MKTSSRERERKAQLLSLWHQRPDGQRTENDVLGFYGEMERAFPQLLNRRSGATCIARDWPMNGAGLLNEFDSYVTSVLRTTGISGVEAEELAILPGST